MKSPNRTTRLILIFIIILAIYASLSMYVFLRTGASKQIAKYAVQLKPQLLSFKDALVRNDIEDQNTDRDIESIIHKQMEAKGKKKWDEAYAILIEGLAKYPKSDKLTTHLGGWFYDQGNWTMAAYWYKQAHYLNPKEHMYPMNVGLCLSNMGKEYEAVEWYQIAYEIHPQTAQLISFVNLLWKFNNWTNYDQYQQKIVSDIRDEIRENKRVSIGSYVALHLPFTLPELKAIAASDSKQIAAGAKKPDEAFQFRNDHERIRVGYVSYDLRNHAVGLQIQSMFMYHDRSKFEIFAYNTNDGLKDPYKDHEVWKKINETCEHPVELGLYPADEAAYRINADGIDILIDLNLFTAHHRMDIFSVRPAPIQAAYLGLATTTGADWIDYLVVDKTVVPRESMEHYSEKLIFMPYSYHIFDHKQMYGQKPKGDRSQHNLPQNKFLYCNHQNNQRLYPEAFDHIANIVKKVPNSALVLKYYNEQAASNIRVEARARGLNVSDNPHESQLIFMHGTGDGSHITMKSMCDLYLDMHNYNGHSTGGDMLWAGVPMVTFPGENMASRAGASFSKSMGAPEMIAESWQEFEDKAVNFATNQEEYSTLRKRIENNRMDSPLFDTKKWVRDLEYGLEQAYKLYREGKGKDHIYVPRDH